MSAYRRVIGSFRLLRRRTAEVGHPGLSVWTDCGERAAVEVGVSVRDGAHKAELGALSIEDRLRGIMADGQVSKAELVELGRLASSAHRVAEQCHDNGEAVK